MDKLPIEVIRQIYEYDSTCTVKFDSFATVDCPYLHIQMFRMFQRMEYMLLLLQKFQNLS